MKKLLALLLTLCLVIGMVPLAASAAGTINSAEALKNAITNASESTEIKLDGSFSVSESVTIESGKDITIDLNGHTLTGTDTGTDSFGLINIQPGADLTIKDSSTDGTGKITLKANENRGWSAYSSVISNQRGKLTVNGGTIEHTGGTDMAYGIDNLTNGTGTYAETIVNGGTVKSTYRAIRQFLNGTEAQNILTVNGGTIVGTNKSIWMQDPSTNANSGTLTVSDEATLVGDVYLFVTEDSIEWPVTVSIADASLCGESEIVTANIPNGIEVKEVGGYWGISDANTHNVAAVKGVSYTSLQEAINAAKPGDTVTLLANVTADSTVNINKSITLDGGSYKISGTASPLLNLSSSADITVQNATLEATNNVIRWNYVNEDYTHTYQNCKISGGVYGIHYDGGGGKVVIDGCTIDGFNTFAGSLEQVTIKDTTFDADQSDYAGANLWGYTEIENVTLVDEGKTTWLDVKATAEVIGGKVVKDGTELSLESYLDAAAKIGTTYYDTLAAAVAVEGVSEITLVSDVELTSQLTIEKGITIEGNGKIIKYTGPEIANGAFITVQGDGDNVTLKNLTVNTDEKAKHGIQFYSVEGGTLENVTVNGGYWTSVIVNGSTDITIKRCTLNPTGVAEHEKKQPYAHIEYAMGENVKNIPSITVDDNTYGTEGVTQIWADKDTTANVKTAMTGDPTKDEIRQKVMDSITNTGTTDVTVAIAVGSNEPGDIEKETSEGEKKPDPEPTDPPVVYPTTYKTTVEECEGGSVVASPSSAREGQKVTLTVKPQAGQELKSLKVTDKDGDAVTLTKVEGGYTFNMPKGGVTVTAVFGCDGGAACPSKGFTDVDSEKWYHEYMDYAVEKGLLEGTSPTTMEPNATLTRAQLAQILYNLEGKPQVQGDLDFTDVAEGKWYYAAILWANQEGVVDGMSPDTFAPNEDISRQDLALMLYRYAGEPTVAGDLDGFKDAGQVGDWAEEAITWAVEEGIIDGMTPTTLEPTGTATRAQAAAMLQRFLEG